MLKVSTFKIMMFRFSMIMYVIICHPYDDDDINVKQHIRIKRAMERETQVHRKYLEGLTIFNYLSLTLSGNC